MRAVKPVKSQTMKDLTKKINELVKENNRKNTEIRQIKSKLRANAHYPKVA